MSNVSTLLARSIYYINIQTSPQPILFQYLWVYSFGSMMFVYIMTMVRILFWTLLLNLITILTI